MPNSTLAQMGFLDEDTQQEAVYDLEDTQARSDISTINGKIPSAASSSNKLVDTTAMNDAIGQAVSSAYKSAGNKTVAELTSSLLVAENRGKVYNMTDAGITTADFVEGAGNPIRIGDDVGICEPTTGTFKFNILSGFIAVDTNPTQGSANPVSSGGVQSEFAGIKDGQSIDSFGDVETALAGKATPSDVAALINDSSTAADKTYSSNKISGLIGTLSNLATTAKNNLVAAINELVTKKISWSDAGKSVKKNLLELNLLDGSKTSNGITIKQNLDGSIRVYGTASGVFAQNIAYFDVEANKAYTLTGTPVGAPTDCYIRAHIGETTYTYNVAVSAGGSTLVRRTSAERVWFDIRIADGTTIDTTFYPMLREASILDDTWEPYIPDNTEVPSWKNAAKSVKRNLIPINASNIVSTNASIFTLNNDGTVRANGTGGTGSSQLWFKIPSNLVGNFLFGGCPEGGKSGNTLNYDIYIWNNTLNQRAKNWDGITNVDSDFGDGNKELRLESGYEYYVSLRVFEGRSVSNIVFKPMITTPDLSCVYEDFVPYIPDNTELMSWEANGVLGCKNLLYNEIATGSSLGITQSTDINGISSVYGTATETKFITVGHSNMRLNLTAGRRYRLSGCPSGGASGTYKLDFRTDINGTTTVICEDIGNGAEFTMPVIPSGGQYQVVLRIHSGTNMGTSGNPKIFKPMITLAEDTVSDYEHFVPFAMSNRELTFKDITSEIVRNTEQTAYSVSSLNINKIGRLVIVTGDVTSLTEDTTPQGHSFTVLATQLPKSLYDAHNVVMPTGEGNQAELYLVHDDSVLQMRGGTINKNYQFVFIYVSKS